MKRSSQEKVEYATKLVGEGLPYQEIQMKLRERFGSGMSNSTLKLLREAQSKLGGKSDRIRQLEQELALFKKGYFEVLTKLERLEGETSPQEINEGENDENHS